MINRDEIVSHISDLTGFTKKDILQVLEAEAIVMEQAIRQGVGIKNHKLFKIELEKKEERTAWDGLNEREFIIPEKYVLKYKPLSRIVNSLDIYNEKFQNSKDLKEGE